MHSSGMEYKKEPSNAHLSIILACILNHLRMESIAWLVLLLASSVSTRSVRYVRPNNMSPLNCPGQPCCTLDQYTEQTATCFTAGHGSTFVFLPGNHSLLTKLRLTSVSNITLKRWNSSVVTILCRDEIVCQNVSDMRVFGLKFLLFGRDMSALRVTESTNVSIDWTNFRGNYLDADKISARAMQVKHSTVNVSNCFFGQLYTEEDGGAILAQNATLLVSKNVFKWNKANRHGGAIFSQGSVIVMDGNLFEGNQANCNGGAISAEESVINISGIHGLHSLNRQDTTGAAQFLSNKAYTGGAMYVLGCTFGGRFVENSAIADGVAVCSARSDHILPCGTQGALRIHVSFTGFTMFDGNEAERGGAIHILYGMVVEFRGSTTFSHNRARTIGGAIASHFATLIFYNTIKFSCNTACENGGAIFTSGANIIFKEHSLVGFTFNSAKNGGGMYLSTMTSLTFKEGVNFKTSHNNASEYGGVIYHKDFTTTTQCEGELLPLCFINFALYRETSGSININATVESYNDSAGTDGSFLFGGLLDRCLMPVHNTFVIPSEAISRNFYIGGFDDVHGITSQPYQLCFCYCNGCTSTSVKIYPGQSFIIQLRAIDQMNRSISTKVNAKVQETAYLKLHQSSQKLPSDCFGLKYSLYSTASSEEVILYPDGPCQDTGLARVVVNLTLIPCPPGFKNTSEQCICEKRLQTHCATCTIKENITSIRRKRSHYHSWIKALYDSNATYQGLITYYPCPKDYCMMGRVKVDLDNPDIQCANNRGGMVCGACATNYSLMLGSSRCGECSNAYLALLLPFAAAGIALVVFLFILRLTVATGMINSVILYANIVQAHKGILLPPNTFKVLTIFIAWMNLDLGIETCFYDGLTAYAETWLQFAFPIYVWMIISIIILTSKYSLTVSKWIGHNPIAVLATLLLMSYTKILKIIIDVYRYMYLEFPEDLKWWKDANVNYLHTKHLVLFVVTSLVLVFTILPYTLFLLVGYKLNRFSDRRLFRWVNKLKPLLDSHHAPYKKDTRHWTGFLLLARSAIYAKYIVGYFEATLSVIVATFTALLFHGRIYSKCYNDVIEKVVLLNLVILAFSGVISINVTLVNSLVGMVFSIMMGIIFYQIYDLYIAKSAIIAKLGAMMSRRFQHTPDSGVEQVPESDNKNMTVSSTIIELREPLLDDSC